MMPASSKFPNFPTQVYLDNADFSSLIDPKRDADWRNWTYSSAAKRLAARAGK